MKKQFAALCHPRRRFVIPAKAGISLLAFALFAACGDEVTQINQTGLEVVSSVDDLPKCNKDNVGEQAYVKGESFARICDGEDWVALDGTDSDFSCKTEELKDKSGLKIVCNGDSIGVVLNGSDGKDGEKGENGDSGSGCSITDRNDSAVVVVCGDSTMTISLGLSGDAAEPDSERIPVSLDSIAGFTQKGPFLKGSTVYLYELSDGKTLKQTNGNFASKITSDDGHYKFTARDLVSPYAMVVVDGYYRNEVTGNVSDAPIRLTALTDMRKHSVGSVNVNLLTHLEYDRVYNLVTREDSTQKKLTVKQAKRQAQKEILEQFHIELDSTKDAESMDVFGSSDADAALLAVSVLLQGDSGTTDLSVLLTEISNDIAEFGEWKNKAGKVKLADWALKADADGRLANFSKNVTGWGLGEAPDFAKFVRNFVGVEDNLGVCGSEGVPVNRAVHITNPASRYYVESYTDSEEGNKYSTERFICKIDSNGVLRWHAATWLEKDTLGWGHNFKDGAVRRGQINGDSVYVYDAGNWRYGTILDDSLELGCTRVRRDTVMGKDGEWYTCIFDKNAIDPIYGNKIGKKWIWRPSLDIEKDTAGWGHDYEEGLVQKGKITDAYYVYMNGNWREASSDETLIGLGCVQKYADTLVSVQDLESTSYYDYDVYSWFLCSFEESDGKGTWKHLDFHTADSIFWDHLPKDTLGTLFKRYPSSVEVKVWDDDELRWATYQEMGLGRGCVSYIEGVKDTFGVTRSIYTCTEKKWVFDTVNVITDPRDNQTYKIIKIGDQYWMAENLNYAYLKPTAELDSSSWCYDNDPANCETYGRLYLWSAAIDSTALDSLGYTCGYGQMCEQNSILSEMHEKGLGICPTGWRLPSAHDFEKLYSTAQSVGDAGANLKSTTGWVNTGNGSDTYGFSALPAGRRNYGNETNPYSWAGQYTDFWSITEGDGGTAYGFGLRYLTNNSTNRNYMDKYYAFSVRCVKDLD